MRGGSRRGEGAPHPLGDRAHLSCYRVHLGPGLQLQIPAKFTGRGVFGPLELLGFDAMAPFTSIDPSSRSALTAGCSAALGETCPSPPGLRKSRLPPRRGIQVASVVLLRGLLPPEGPLLALRPSDHWNVTETPSVRIEVDVPATESRCHAWRFQASSTQARSPASTVT
jgi:hypothetical protein